MTTPPQDTLAAIVAEMRNGEGHLSRRIDGWADRIEALAASAQVREVEAWEPSQADIDAICPSCNCNPCLCDKPAAQPAPVAQVPAEVATALHNLMDISGPGDKKEIVAAYIADHARRESELGALADAEHARAATAVRERKEAEASLAACRADAERLDWMESNLCRAGEVRDNAGNCIKLARVWTIMGELETLRETIDAARSQP